MNPLLISSVLIIGFALLTYFFNKITHWRICVICAGVSLTWLSLTFFILKGLFPASYFLFPIAILMGGTVVGIAFQGEKRFKWASNLFYWKGPVVVIGFIIAYLLLVNMSWTAFAIELVLLGFLTYFLFLQPSVDKSSSGRNTTELERKLEDCC